MEIMLMRAKSKPIRFSRAALGAGLLFAVAIALVSAPKPAFNKHKKAFYLDEKDINYLRPGLKLTILTGAVAADGTVTATYKVTDPLGVPLDIAGVETPGPITVSFLIAYIPKGASQYVDYNTRIQTSPITNKSAVQGSTDSGGKTEKIADGTYRYTFGTKLPSGYDRTATHSIGAYSTRNLTEFAVPNSFSDFVFNFVPDGSKVSVVRDVVATATCNKCHNPLSAHGGARQKVELCVLCHTPQTIDPDTGNTIDLKVMAHKIHMGSSLPSVVAGTPYQIIGFNQSVVDFSGIVLPSDARNCTFCHEQSGERKTTQSTNYLKPSRAACGSCHDNVNFATGEGHSGATLVQTSDNQCATCHVPQGELEFDASVVGAHTIPRFSMDLPGTVFELMRVTDGVAGKRPTVQFRVKDKKGNVIPASQMSRLQLVLAGPTSDYASSLSEDVRAAAANSDGSHNYTFSAAATIPANASGTFAVGIEGYRNVTLLPGTETQQVVRDAGVNQQIYFSVDGSKLALRRKVVDLAKCNSCHSSLSLHGDNRNTIDQCVLCHNPNQTDVGTRPKTAGAPQSVNFALMIHKIHTGENLTSEYTVYGFGGSKNDFSDILFPGDRRDCTKCHVNGSEHLPLNENLLPVTDPRGLINPVGAATSACTGCHTGSTAASHAKSNTTTLGESCAVCHSNSADYSVDKVHAR
jgi:OmcA/MtrC family decaheme c-type cytochrome